MLKSEKSLVVSQIRDRFSKAKSVIFAEYRGLKVEQLTTLRKELGKEKASLNVVKNRLVKRALKEVNIEGLDSFFSGPTAVASSEVDAVVPAKILVAFNKENEALQIKGGYLDGEVLSLDRIRQLASLPSREELYAQLLRCMNGPAQGLVQVLSAVPRGLVTALDAIAKTKQ